MYCSGCVFGVLALRSRHSCDLEDDRTQKKASFKPNARSSSVASGVRNQGHRTCVPGGLPVSPEVLFHPVFPTGPPSQKDGARQADGPGLGRPWPIGPRITGLMPSRPPGGAGVVPGVSGFTGTILDWLLQLPPLILGSALGVSSSCALHLWDTGLQFVSL